MPVLPDRANLDHLKKQAKELLRDHRSGDPAATARFARTLPAAANKTPEQLAASGLRLHDAQSCIAREYGFASWSELAQYVEERSAARGDREAAIRSWLNLAYGGDVTGSYRAPRPRLAARLLEDDPDLLAVDALAACAIGDGDAARRAIAADPDWVNRPAGPLALPPLVAVTHSRLGQLPTFRTHLQDCVRLLLAGGADPNQAIGNRFPPASLAAPDERNRLSALYGAAGVNRDPAMTLLLLDAGADPNDKESLYHSLENPACTRLLLERGARVAGTNALRRAFDMPDATALELLLAHGGDPNEKAPRGPTNAWGPPLLRAIAVRRSPRHIAALLAAGADPRARTPAGISAYRLAQQVGLPDIVELLRQAGAAEELTEDEDFVAACARADRATAQRIRSRRPDLPGSLPAERLRLLPDTVAWGSGDAAKVMVELGWPLDARGGDWDATALNHAVLRGDPEMTAFLLAHGADWRERQGYGSDVLGTLSWASLNEPQASRGDNEPQATQVDNEPQATQGHNEPQATQGDNEPQATLGDWAGCTRALVVHGLPRAERDAAEPGRLWIGGRAMAFSDAVMDVLLAASD